MQEIGNKCAGNIVPFEYDRLTDERVSDPDIHTHGPHEPNGDRVTLIADGGKMEQRVCRHCGCVYVEAG